MSILCSIGMHKWIGCKCSICDKKRNQDHDWSEDCEKCSRCEAARQNAHKWQGCKCMKCSQEKHQWQFGKCIVCGCREPATIAFNPAHLAVDGRALAIGVNGVEHYYNAREARHMLQALANQYNSDGQPRDSRIGLTTIEGQVTIVHEDAAVILSTLGRLVQTRLPGDTTMLDLMAGS